MGSRFANRRALFVLDNVHIVAPGTLAGAFNAWRKLVEPPKVLSTCRGELAAAADAYGPRTLRIRREVTEDDFLAAYRRLARRFWQTDDLPLPPPEVLREWRAFSGDLLVAFCLAVTPALPNYGRGSEWRLERQRAVEYVQATYLDALPEAERNLANSTGVANEWQV